MLGLSAPRSADALDPARRITQYGHDVWQIEEGLPHNTVKAITQTRDGYLWLGTLEGLVRFDGVRFTVFDNGNTPALRDSSISALFEDRSGALWIGTDSGGLVRHRDGRFTAYGSGKGDTTTPVTAIVQDRSGVVWVGTQVLGVLQVKDDTLVPYPGLSSSRTVSALHVDDAGRLWVGSRSQGVTVVEGGVLRPYTKANGLISDDVRCFGAGPDGTTWVGTEKGLNRIGTGGVQDSVPLDYGVRVLHRDRGGSLWIGSGEHGLARLRGGELLGFSTAQGLPSLSVRAFFEDREGSLWVGMADGGLNRFRDGHLTTIGPPEGLAAEVVVSVHADARDGLWAGTRGGGLNLIRGDTITSVTTKDGLSSDSVVSLDDDAEGALWAGTIGAGLNRLRDGAVRVYRAGDGLASDNVFAILGGRDGSLWIGTRGAGLNRMTASGIAAYGKPEGLQSPFVWDLAEDAAGTVWIASASGLYAHERGAIRQVIPDIPAHTLHVDADGVVWAGTARRGLYRWKDGRAAAFTTRDGLLNDNVTQVLEDGRGNLWLGSNQGISRVAKRELDDVAEKRSTRITHVSYDSADGMRSRECNYGTGTRTRDGRLWFPTIRGVVVVDPERLATNTVVPPVHLEEVVANGHALDVSGPGEAVVPPGDGRLELRYTALSYLAPRKVRFSYRLEGFDPGWSEPGTRREATYTNLPPGRYTFRVRACNNDGLWNEAGASFALHLRPHFYQTAWFGALVAVLLGGLAWRIHLFRAQRMVEMERVRTRIAADLHDDIGAGLSQIAVLSEVASQELRRDGPRALDSLGRIADTAGELVDSMSDIVWAVNPRNDRLEDLVRRMRGFASEVSSARGMDLRFHAEGVDGQRLGPDLRRHVYLIFKEGFSNAARHSGSARIEVDLEIAGGRLVLRVKDDGCGFDTSRPSDGNGLTTMTARAADLGGRAEIVSRPGEGTVLTLNVPLGRS